MMKKEYAKALRLYTYTHTGDLKNNGITLIALVITIVLNCCGAAMV